MLELPLDVATMADVLLVVLGLEWLALILFWRVRTRPDAVRRATLIVLPGVFLVMALRLAATGADPRQVGLALLAAGIVHAVDLIVRLRR